MSTVSTGNQAEQAVAEELERKGYEIIVLNWRTKFAEIDIVARKGQIIFFIEVKYRRSGAAGDGFDYITPKKLHHMQRAAEAWVMINNWQSEYQLLAAAVSGDYQTIDIREI